MSVSSQTIQAAAVSLRDQVLDTPCLYSRTLSEITGAEVHLKFENPQPRTRRRNHSRAARRRLRGEGPRRMN